MAAGGAVLALATIPPVSAAAAPAGARNPLAGADDRLKEARAVFDVADKLPQEWRGLNPEPPTGRRAIKRWKRREGKYRFFVTMPPWRAVLAAEDDFRAARLAVAKVDARETWANSPSRPACPAFKTLCTHPSQMRL
jgi:hypothetical protein